MSWNVTVVDAPGARKTLSKPLRLFGADFAEAGRDKYNCGIYRMIENGSMETCFERLTSVPATDPVFVRVKVTVTTGVCNLCTSVSALLVSRTRAPTKDQEKPRVPWLDGILRQSSQ